MDALLEDVLRADNLPSPSSVALEIVRLTRSMDTDPSDLGRLIATDPAIAARVIRVVNAPTYGVRRRVASIEQAVGLLGFRAVSRIALSFSVLDRNRAGVQEFDYDAFWGECLAVSVAAGAVARRTGRAAPDEAFTYGLLSGTGRLALVTVYSERYRDLLLTLGSATPDELADAERAVFCVDAEELSAHMMDSWGMPALRDALQSESEPGAAPECERERERSEDVLRHVRVAAKLGRVLVDPAAHRDQLAELVRSLEGLGLGAEQLSPLFAAVAEAYQETGSLLEIPTRDVPSLAEVYAQATP
ncbi:MAG: HDOD domain-containing protein [Planctomycetota bacterium]